jgi:nucleoside-diphosphate-sugar epimerase
MAARTDLDGTTLADYSSNTDGVAALIECAARLPSLERVIFTSSQYVHRLGYIPKDEVDYNPHTVYGESKVIGEQLVRALAADRFHWTIVRPTSLWGPWFEVPYRDFFGAVARGRYMHPRGRRIRRSYGFVLNAVHQIQQVASCPDPSLVDKKVFYLADYLPTDILEWATLISREFSVKPPRQVPYALLKSIALCGDLAKRAGVKKVPLSSFRLKNLLTNVVYDMSSLFKVAGETPHTLDDAVSRTVNWMKSHP